MRTRVLKYVNYFLFELRMLLITLFTPYISLAFSYFLYRAYDQTL
jgi:hypothetical protein